MPSLDRLANQHRLPNITRRRPDARAGPTQQLSAGLRYESQQIARDTTMHLLDGLRSEYLAPGQRTLGLRIACQQQVKSVTWIIDLAKIQVAQPADGDLLADTPPPVSITFDRGQRQRDPCRFGNARQEAPLIRMNHDA
jgi:hypothetical protein